MTPQNTDYILLVKAVLCKYIKVQCLKGLKILFRSHALNVDAHKYGPLLSFTNVTEALARNAEPRAPPRTC